MADESAPRPTPERRQRTVGMRRAVRSIKAQYVGDRSTVENIADVLTTVAGSTPFLIGHTLWFLVWIPWNTGLLGLRPFDPFPFGLLTMIVSLEAIFLTIFVLMAQNRESQIAELREEVTLQVLFRTEEELTKTLQLVAGLYTRLGHKVAEDPDLLEMLRPLNADEIERQLIDEIRRARALEARRERKLAARD